eukprot:6455176-Amphidinium_carterae.1
MAEVTEANKSLKTVRGVCNAEMESSVSYLTVQAWICLRTALHRHRKRESPRRCSTIWQAFVPHFLVPVGDVWYPILVRSDLRSSRGAQPVPSD